MLDSGAHLPVVVSLAPTEAQVRVDIQAGRNLAEAASANGPHSPLRAGRSTSHCGIRSLLASVQARIIVVMKVLGFEKPALATVALTAVRYLLRLTRRAVPPFPNRSYTAAERQVKSFHATFGEAGIAEQLRFGKSRPGGCGVFRKRFFQVVKPGAAGQRRLFTVQRSRRKDDVGVLVGPGIDGCAPNVMRVGTPLLS